MRPVQSYFVSVRSAETTCSHLSVGYQLQVERGIVAKSAVSTMKDTVNMFCFALQCLKCAVGFTYC